VAKKAKKNKKSQAKKKDNASTSQLFNFAQDSYLERTSRPIYAIWFLLPFIVFYEVGTILINTDVLNQSQTRVVAFVWLRELLDSIGFGGKLALVAPPLVVVAILFALQVTSRKRWNFDVRDVFPMAAECIALAVPLIVLILFLNSFGVPQGDSDHVARRTMPVEIQLASETSGGVSALPVLTAHRARKPASRLLLANTITAIGAGIYEELVFRLILICALMMLFQDMLRLDQKNSIVLSVLISAALFSAYHYIDFRTGELDGDPFELTSFAFRTMAGVYFAVLFAVRGFGITAGTHAFYDIIATMIKAFFFQPQ